MKAQTHKLLQKTTLITGKVKIVLQHLKYNFIYYVIAVIGVTAFFAHESLSYNTTEKVQAENAWKQDKDRRTIALNNLKEASKHLPEYNAYWEEKEKTDKAYKTYLSVLTKEKFLGFKNVQQFMGEFGWALGLFIYSFFNLIITFIDKPKNTLHGRALMHATFIAISIFYLRWCFNRVDYLGEKYVLFNIATVFMIVLSTFIMVRYKEKMYKKLKRTVHVLSMYLWFDVNKHIKPESKCQHQKDLDNVLREGMKYE